MGLSFKFKEGKGRSVGLCMCAIRSILLVADRQLALEMLADLKEKHVKSLFIAFYGL